MAGLRAFSILRAPVLLAVFWTSPPLLAQEDEPPQNLQLQCIETCGNLKCDVTRFEGFSTDSTQIGFTLLQCPGEHAKDRSPRETYHIRKLVGKRGKLTMEGIRLNGLSYPKYFKREKYGARELEGVVLDDNLWEFGMPDGSQVRISLRTEEKITWYLEHVDSQLPLLTYHSEFKEIYFKIYPRVFVSPDETRIAVVLVLDAMVQLDTGLAVFGFVR